MKPINIFIIFISFLFLISCTNDSESDLIGRDIPIAITYTNSVKSIMDSNCINCHANTPTNGAPMSLISYQNVKDAVLNRGLIDRVSKAQDAPGMMPSGGNRLPQSLINQITNWKNNGFPE